MNQTLADNVEHQTRCKLRNISGILLLDKPPGMTSNASLQIIKRLFNARKAGHTGSLDPIATGLLPVCLGEATKISSYLLEADKTYQATMCLGVKTDTGDSDGRIMEKKVVANVTKAAVNEVLASLTGEIEQTPPMHSAVKYKGKPLYRLAHQGIEVARKPRRVVIHQLDLLSLKNECLKIRVKCSKGTYIRTLAEEIGHQLGCGAHITALRRTVVGDFQEDKMLSLDYLKSLAEQKGTESLDKCLLSTESALAHWPDVRLSADAAFFLQQGQAVFVHRLPTEGLVRIFARPNDPMSNSSGDNPDHDRFLGIGHILPDGRLAPKRLINI